MWQLTGIHIYTVTSLKNGQQIPARSSTTQGMSLMLRLNPLKLYYPVWADSSLAVISDFCWQTPLKHQMNSTDLNLNEGKCVQRLAAVIMLFVFLPCVTAPAKSVFHSSCPHFQRLLFSQMNVCHRVVLLSFRLTQNKVRLSKGWAECLQFQNIQECTNFPGNANHELMPGLWWGVGLSWHEAVTGGHRTHIVK